MNHMEISFNLVLIYFIRKNHIYFTHDKLISIIMDKFDSSNVRTSFFCGQGRKKITRNQLDQNQGKCIACYQQQSLSKKKKLLKRKKIPVIVVRKLPTFVARSVGNIFVKIIQMFINP